MLLTAKLSHLSRCCLNTSTVSHTQSYTGFIFLCMVYLKQHNALRSCPTTSKLQHESEFSNFPQLNCLPLNVYGMGDSYALMDSWFASIFEILQILLRRLATLAVTLLLVFQSSPHYSSSPFAPFHILTDCTTIPTSTKHTVVPHCTFDFLLPNSNTEHPFP